MIVDIVRSINKLVFQVFSYSKFHYELILNIVEITTEIEIVFI